VTAFIVATSQRTRWYARAVKTAPRVLALPCLAAGPGRSATVEITVKDGRDAAIEQPDKQFVPLVSVVRAGTPG